MARKGLFARQQKLETLRQKYASQGKKMPKSARHYNRCQLCGRVRSYMREFGICRVCFRKYARQGMIMGVKKSSW